MLIVKLAQLFFKRFGLLLLTLEQFRQAADFSLELIYDFFSFRGEKTGITGFLAALSSYPVLMVAACLLQLNLELMVLT